MGTFVCSVKCCEKVCILHGVGLLLYWEVISACFCLSVSPASYGLEPITWKNLYPELLVSTLENNMDFDFDIVKDALRRVCTLPLMQPILSPPLSLQVCGQQCALLLLMFTFYMQMRQQTKQLQAAPHFSLNAHAFCIQLILFLCVWCSVIEN